MVDGVLRAHVAAPAVGGAANQSLLHLLADELEVARRDVRIVAGATGRQKLVVVDGVEPRPSLPAGRASAYDRGRRRPSGAATSSGDWLSG